MKRARRTSTARLAWFCVATLISLSSCNPVAPGSTGTRTYDSFDVPFSRGEARLCGWEMVDCSEQSADLWKVQQHRSKLDNWLVEQGVNNGRTVVVNWR